jgi:cyclophilin family peptidyl-prolyl cis-trans isomerase
MKARKNSRRFPLGLDNLEDRALMAAPVLAVIPNAQVPASKTFMLPVTATDSDGDPLTYTVTSDNGTVLSTVRTGHPYLKMSVANYGDMIFQLFDDIAPTTVNTIAGLANNGAYNGIIFHRVIQNFMIQGGDPNGTGTGSLLGSSQFNDEFSPEAIFSGTGQLAMANSGKDTNGSQFFITSGPQRFLDFNHAIFGQLVRGFDVQQAISAVPVNGSSKPLTSVVITSMSLVNNTTDSVIQLKSTGVGTTRFTVTVSDGKGGTDSKTFTATSSTDTTNDPPILGPVTNQVTYTNTSLNINLSAFDYENNPLTYAAQFADATPPGTFNITGNVVTVTPNTGYKGTFGFYVGVKETSATTRGSTSSPWDLQGIQITVGDPFTIATQAVNIQEGATLSNTVISKFTPLKPKSAASYTATIDWGDGRMDNGVVTAVDDGSYTVKGTGIYQKYGTYPIAITVKDNIDNVSISGSTTATITDAPVSVLFVTPVRPTGSGVINGTLAEITDNNLAGLAADLSASISWGDGTSSSGTITKLNGKFLVSGSKTYSSFGSFTISVTASSSGNQTASGSGSINIANAAPVFSALDNQSVIVGRPLVFQAKATDSDIWQTINYQLAANSPTFLSIQPDTGNITVGANAPLGSYTLTVIANDNGSPSQSTQKSVQILVAEPFTIATQPVNSQEGTSLANTIVTKFTPLKPKTASNYTATITWGDGRIDNGVVSALGDGTYSVKGTGIYQKYGTYPIAITVKDNIDNVSISGTTTATVTDAPISMTFLSPIRPNGSGLINGTVAEITDNNLAGLASDISAVINWGDGTTSPGTITKSNGKFLVSGSKSYSSFGTFTISVTASSTGNQSASTSGNVIVANSAPIFSALSDQSVIAGSPLIFQAKATDSDSWQTLSYQLSGNIPNFVGIQSANGIVTVSSNAPVGTYSLTIVANDNGAPSQSAIKTVQITVNPVPAPPALVKPLSITAVRLKSGQVTSINLTFSDALNATTASRLSNFQIISSAGRDKRFGTKDDVLFKVASVKYNASTRTITIVPSGRLIVSATGLFTIRAIGLTDSLGRAIDGNRDGVAGGDLFAKLTKSAVNLS